MFAPWRQRRSERRRRACGRSTTWLWTVFCETKSSLPISFSESEKPSHASSQLGPRLVGPASGDERHSDSDVDLGVDLGEPVLPPDLGRLFRQSRLLVDQTPVEPFQPSNGRSRFCPSARNRNDEPAHDELPLIKWAARLLPRDLRGPTQSVSGSQHEVVRGFGQSKRRPCNEVVSLPCHQCFRRALDLKTAFGRQRPLQSRAQFRRQSRRPAQRAHFHPLWVTVVCPVLNETSSIGIRVDSRG